MADESSTGRGIQVDTEKLFGRGVTTPKVGEKPTRPEPKPAD